MFNLPPKTNSFIFSSIISSTPTQYLVRCAAALLDTAPGLLRPLVVVVVVVAAAAELEREEEAGKEAREEEDFGAPAPATAAMTGSGGGANGIIAINFISTNPIN